jgi:hypothetical protein
MDAALSPLGAAIATIVVLLIAWGFLPQLVSGAVKAGARVIFNIHDDPNIEFGSIRPDLENGWTPYNTLYHVECVNRPLSGWRRRFSRTNDAMGCRATIEAAPSSGPGATLRDDAIFTLGATSDVIATLYVDKPVWIPVYWIAPTSGSQTPPGPAAEQGYYMAGAGFMVNRRWFKHRLPPNTYRMKVGVIWNQEPFLYEFELAVPF